MKEPTHNIKLYSGNNVPCPDSTWYESAPHWYQNNAHGWLASGIFDKNGKEIYEGDRVKFGEHEHIGTVNFRNAMFIIAHDNSDRFTVLGNTIGFVSIEIIGHIAEEQP